MSIDQYQFATVTRAMNHPKPCGELYDFLRQWWIGHILTVDHEMGAAMLSIDKTAT